MALETPRSRAIVGWLPRARLSPLWIAAALATVGLVAALLALGDTLPPAGAVAVVLVFTFTSSRMFATPSSLRAGNPQLVLPSVATSRHPSSRQTDARKLVHASFREARPIHTPRPERRSETGPQDMGWVSARMTAQSRQPSASRSR